MTTLARRLQQRIERSCERFGTSYPWWIPAYSTLVTVAIAVAAWVQRGGVDAPPSTYVALGLSAYPVLVWLPRGWLPPRWFEAATTVAAVWLFLVHPVRPDLAPLLLLMAAGEIAAVSGIVFGTALATLDVAVLVVAGAAGHLSDVALYAVGVVLAADVGLALHWHMRALTAERANTALAQERAIAGERQRLAREVHDVVGHSLSINLLHVTAARHALQQHGDVADAIESLTEAERVGRSAMGDLRRTVAVLGAGPGETAPLPGVPDIASLVDRSRAAGLDVTYSVHGDPARLGDAAGLGLFRIVQESLGNIARHVPTAVASVSLVDDGHVVRLTVCNSLPDGPPAAGDGGTGLAGMTARAEQLGAQLRAGVDGDRWLVEVTVPVAEPGALSPAASGPGALRQAASGSGAAEPGRDPRAGADLTGLRG